MLASTSKTQRQQQACLQISPYISRYKKQNMLLRHITNNTKAIIVIINFPVAKRGPTTEEEEGTHLLGERSPALLQSRQYLDLEMMVPAVVLPLHRICLLLHSFAA